MAAPVEWLGFLGEWPVAAALRRSSLLYPLANAAHILSLAVLVGAIAVLDLRVLGLFRTSPLAHLGPPLARAAAAGLALAVLTGFLLFSTRPLTYAENPAFLLKLGLLVLGALNALALRAAPAWRAALQGDRISLRVRLGAAFSLMIWVSAVVAGRWIGFLQ